MRTLRPRRDRWERFESRDARTILDPSRQGLGRRVVVGIDDGEASLRAVKVAAAMLGDSHDLILLCATRRRRTEADTELHDALKHESYLLTGRAGIDERLRTAAELAKWHGARQVSTMSEDGDPVAVLHRVAQRTGAGAVVVGTGRGRPGWTARRLARRLDDEVALIVTDGSVHHRRQAVPADELRDTTWHFPWPVPAPEPA
ncbi:universal stress protein [Gordonia terrae]|uniref:universal stress protein n=1 Tax=Gordonia terrae TaxID=2055 RepID=UPI003F6A8A38